MTKFLLSALYSTLVNYVYISPAYLLSALDVSRNHTQLASFTFPNEYAKAKRLCE